MSVLYTPGSEPNDIRKRLNRFFEKLDSAYPDKVVKSLHKDHKKWGEALTKLYRELGYESGNALLEAYGYTVIASDNKGGRTSALSVDEVIAEFKSRYKDGPQYDNLKDLLAANEDLTSYCKKAQNNAAELFGMSFAAYLVSIGVLKVKKSARNAQEPTIKERFDSLIEQLQAKYAGSEVLPKNILELKKQCSDLDVSHIESWALKSYGVSAEEYLREKGLLTENKKKDNCKEMSLKEARKLFRVSVEEDSVNITKYKGTDEHVEVPSHIDGTPVKGVKFDFCKEIKSVVLPDTVDSIWGHAFQNCSNLEKIVLPDTIKKIHGSAFSGCVKLKDINIPADVEYIGDYIFNDCDSLANENQMVIFGNIFYKYCGKEKEVSIPSGVKCIDGSAFYGNQVIEKVYIPDGVLRIGRMAFDGCSQLKEVRIPESIIEIGDYAFAGCKNIKKFNLPEGFENIGSNVFDGCDGLADDNGMIVFNNCLYKYLYSCNRIGVMRTLIIPEGITSIADYAFYFCQLIRKVVMPNTLKKIGKQAFYECSQLIDINISDSVKEIGAMAFAGCGYLANENGFVIINNTLYDSFSREKNIHIPDEVKEISTWAFYQSDYEAEHLETVVVPESVIKINTSAFAYCQKLQKVFLPDTLEEIQEKAFDCCPNVVLNVKKDSLAEKYATDNNMKFDILHD